MNFLEQRKKQLGIKSIGEKVRDKTIKSEIDTSLYVHGPEHFDHLTNRWARKETMFILGGSGGGKTALTLYFFKEILQNNPDPNSICIFFSLELTEEQIYKNWKKVIGKNHELSNRLYVVSNFDDEGKPRDITTGGILAESLKIKNGLGADVLCVALDHLQIVCESSMNESINRVCGKLRQISVELDTLFIVLSQTTKVNQAEYSDIPLFKSDGFGGSAITWYATWIISIHQPLKRVYDEARLPILAWSYVKIRYQDPKDGGVENKFKLMYYDVDTGTPRKMSRDELHLFNQYYALVIQKREAEDKNKGRKIPSYDVKDTVMGFSTTEKAGMDVSELVIDSNLSELDDVEL